MSVREYSRGSIVFREGDPVDYIAIVKSGEFQVSKKVPGNI